MSFWDEIISQIKVSQIFFTPGRGMEGRNRRPFEVKEIGKDIIIIKSGNSYLPLEKLCFDAVEEFFRNNPDSKLRVASLRSNEPLEGSADKIIREKTGSNLARGNYVCAILEKFGLVKYVMDGNIKYIKI